MNFDHLRKNRYINNFIKDKKLILAVAVIIIFWSIIYLISFYKPIYVSNAKVLIKDTNPKNFVTRFDAPTELTTLTDESNPVLTQVEVLKSRQLQTLLKEYIDSKYPNALKDVKDKETFIGQLIKIKPGSNTDTISIFLKWNNPVIAQDILRQTLFDFEDINSTMNKRIKKERRIYIDKQVNEIREKLLNVRKAVKQYKLGTLAINLEEESNGLVKQKLEFSTLLENTRASIQNTKGKLNNIQKQLSLSPKEALNAAALGAENRNLIDLRDELHKTVQQYSFDIVKFSPQNPKIIAARNKIKTIQRQIRDQIKLTLGKTTDDKGINILDPVRQNLVQDFATLQASLIGLNAQERSLKNSIAKINAEQHKIPSKKFALDNLEQQESNMSAAYDQLISKQIEAKIQEVETVSNVVVIDQASLPINRAFPSKTHVVFLAGLLGIILGLSVSILKTYVEDVCEGVSEIERVTEKTVIGVLPWMTPSMTENEIKMVKNISYEGILSNLMIKSYKNKAKVLTFSSSSIKKSNSKNIYIIANELRKLGNSVAVIDTDFRNPSLHKEARITPKITTNFSENLLKAEKLLRENREHEIHLEDCLTVDANGISYLVNKTPINNPYEYFGSMAISIIINKLRENFDWVLINAPTILIAPETLLISRMSDGFILITDIKVTYSYLVNVVKTLNNAEVPFFGCIIRDKSSNLRKNYLEFLNCQDNRNYAAVKS